MWIPGDLLTDLDLLAIDRLCLTDFGVTALTDKRQVAAAWVAQRVEQAGYLLHQHQIRRAPDAVYGYTGAAFLDYTSAAQTTTDADLPLSSVCAVPSSAAIYIGSRDPFRGVYMGIVDSVNANACVLTARVWTGAWSVVTSLADGTQATAGRAFSGGGLVSWQLPDAWSRRSINNSLLYWAKLTVSTSLTAGTAAAQIAPVVASRLTLPASQYALALLYQQSYGSQRGQWQEKATALFASASDALGVALPLIADEFDVTDDDQVSRTEVTSVTSDHLTTWERG